MQEWVNYLGTAENQTGPNGVAWHKDQNGNIFLSGDFGEDPNSANGRNRWMITNLAATSFVSTGRTGSDKAVVQSFGSSPSATGTYSKPYWAYPSSIAYPPPNQSQFDPTNSSQYNKRQRLGRLYNWSAATNSLGGTGGQNNPADAQGAQNYPTHRKIQGICPNGWHLPSDYEWTELENEIIKNTSLYSNSPDIKTPLLDPSNNNSKGARGKHALIFADICELSNIVPASNSPFEGGFSALLAGYASTGSTGLLGKSISFWTSSSNGTGDAWRRNITSNLASMTRDGIARDYFFSVRCKKD